MKRLNYSKICLNTYLPILVCLFALGSALFTYYTVTQKNQQKIHYNATHEGGLVIKLSQGFIRAYSDFEAKYASGILPNPAVFRRHALERADLDSLFGSALHSEVVGFPGKAITKEPSDQDMRRQMLSLQTNPDGTMETTLLTRDEKTIHRAIWPFYATDQTCVNCHNNIQKLTGLEQWKIGDLMGAQIVEKDISLQLKQAKQEAWMISVLMFFAVIAVLYCFIFIFRQAFLTKKLKQLASTDAMTGCINRREMYARINKIPDPISGAILMLDIDKFKKINDTYGHSTGDVVIKALSNQVRKQLRQNDWVARIGGEEFLVWLPHTTKQDAITIAERLRQQVESSHLDHDGNRLCYTISIGIHAFVDASPTQFKSWMSKADQQLYCAKNQGRNCVVSG